MNLKWSRQSIHHTDGAEVSSFGFGRSPDSSVRSSNAVQGFILLLYMPPNLFTSRKNNATLPSLKLSSFFSLSNVTFSSKSKVSLSSPTYSSRTWKSGITSSLTSLQLATYLTPELSLTDTAVSSESGAKWNSVSIFFFQMKPFLEWIQSCICVTDG